MRPALEQQSGKPIPDAEMAQLKMGMADDGRFVFDRKFGLMKEVIVNRRVTSGPETRTDRWEIRLTQAPKR